MPISRRDVFYGLLTSPLLLSRADAAEAIDQSRYRHAVLLACHLDGRGPTNQAVRAIEHESD